MERQLGVSECKELRQLLVKHENLLLALLEDLDTEIVKKRDKNTARLCEETALLSTLITELEGKCQQPAHELLQVRLHRTQPVAGREQPLSPWELTG